MKKIIIISFLILNFNVVAEQKGSITSSSCPYSCRTQGIDKRFCRDWKNGNTCYVEDLRKTLRPNQPTSESNNTSDVIFGAGSPSSNNWNKKSAACQETSRLDIASPYINVDRVQDSGNFLGNKQRAFGSIEGVCIVEAGYFEFGRKIQNIPVKTSRDFQRFDFNIQFRPERNPEIRVYNIHGDRVNQFLSDPNANQGYNYR